MESTISFTRDSLQLEVAEDHDEITIRFFGKSLLKDPGAFMMPIFLDLLAKSNDGERRVVLDFRKLSYMNSSTLTPLIKILERARLGRLRLAVVYLKSMKWQDISFSALTIFQTPDLRIEIRGDE
jgi:hypothetical protein